MAAAPEMARRGGSPVWVGNGRFRNVKGVEALQRRIAAIPAGVVADVKPALEKSADELVAKIKPIVPVDPTSKDPGRLRESVHKEPGDHELAVKVVEDGVDDDGRPNAKHVEYGHRAVDGTHVAAVPHFWSAYQVLKRKIRGRVGRGMTAGAKKAFAKPQGSDDA